MTEETDLDPEVAELRQAYEELFKEMGGVQCEFEKGVKLITREKNLVRAMPWFRKFIRSKWGSE
jgi:hypothetical protein